MPQEWNNGIWVCTAEELVPRFWNNLAALQQEIHRYEGQKAGVKRVQKGGRGRQLLVDFDSLPKEMRDILGDPRRTTHIMERFYSVDGNAARYFVDFRYPNGNSLPADTQSQYVVNVSVANAVIKLREARTFERITKGGNLKGLIQTLCRDAETFNKVLDAKYNVTHNLPSHPTRFGQKMNEYERIGYISFIKDANAKGRQNARKVTPETIRVLNNLFATQKHKPTPTEVAQQYNAFLDGYVEVIDKETGEIYSPKGFKSLDKRTITGYLAAWENKIGTWQKRSGNRQKLMSQFKPYHSLEAPTKAGSLISIDDRQPPFWYAKGKRAWAYMAIDLASEVITCWVFGKNKEGIIIDFYRQLVRNYTSWGLPVPMGLECESSLNSSFKNTFLAEGSMFDYVRIEANNARGKRIEAYYKPLRYQHEKRREGWIARPTALSEPNQALEEKQPQIVDYDQIINECLHDIWVWNNTEHSKHKGISRWDYFMQNQNADNKETNWKSILPYMGHRTETSCNLGIMKLQRSEWLLGNESEVALGEELIRLMKLVEGKEIVIYWLDDNEGKVLKALVYEEDQTGEPRYICEAVAKPRYQRAVAEQTDHDREQRAIMSAYVATIEAFGRSQMRAIEPVTIIDNRPKVFGTSFQMPGYSPVIKTEESEVEILEDRDDDVWTRARIASESTQVPAWKRNFQI